MNCLVRIYLEVIRFYPLMLNACQLCTLCDAISQRKKLVLGTTTTSIHKIYLFVKFTNVFLFKFEQPQTVEKNSGDNAAILNAIWKNFKFK